MNVILILAETLSLEKNPCSSLHQIQDDVTGLQGGQWNCLCLHPSIGQTTHLSSSSLLNFISWTPGADIAKSKQRLIIKVTTTAVLAPQWWNELPVMSGPESLTSFRKGLKTHFLRVHLDSACYTAVILLIGGMVDPNQRIDRWIDY